MARPIHAWEIAIDRRATCAVLIFATRAGMAAWRRGHCRCPDGKPYGEVSPFEAFAAYVDNRGRMHGVVLFHVGCFDPGTIAHELTHIAHFRVSRPRRGQRGWRPLTIARHKEKLAETMDTLTSQFYKRYWRYLEPRSKCRRGRP